MTEQLKSFKENDTIRLDGTYEIDDEDDGYEYDDCGENSLDIDYTTQA